MFETFLINPLFTEPMAPGRERYFVRSGSRWPSSYPKRTGVPGRYIPFPFSLAYSAALLEREGHPVSVLDAVAGNESLDSLISVAGGKNANLILFEATTPTFEMDMALARRLKDLSGADIAVTGAHATTFAQEILEQEAQVDYVLLYEFEATLLELVTRKAEGGDLASIPGIGYRQGREVFLQEAYRPIDPLDALPLPARHLFPSPARPDMYAYWDGFCQHRPAVQMHASRGCPFRCDFCLWVQVMYRNGKHRTFSPGRVVEEMEEVVSRYGAKEIYFDDDDFTVNKRHVLGICSEITRRGLRVPWSCMGDAVVPDEEMLDAMADAGCVGMKFGVESAAPPILEHLGKPVDPERVRNVARWCARRKIKTHATMTFGLGQETMETMETSLSFARELDVDSIQFSITAPFPGTRYFEELDRAGRIGTRNWQQYDGSRSTVVDFPDLTTEEVQRACREAPSTWLLGKIRDPKWLLRQARYLLRLARGTGLTGMTGRVRRAAEILRG